MLNRRFPNKTWFTRVIHMQTQVQTKFTVNRGKANASLKQKNLCFLFSLVLLACPCACVNFVCFWAYACVAQAHAESGWGPFTKIILVDISLDNGTFLRFFTREPDNYSGEDMHVLPWQDTPGIPLEVGVVPGAPRGWGPGPTASVAPLWTGLALPLRNTLSFMCKPLMCNVTPWSL